MIPTRSSCETRPIERTQRGGPPSSFATTTQSSSPPRKEDDNNQLFNFVELVKPSQSYQLPCPLRNKQPVADRQISCRVAAQRPLPTTYHHHRRQVVRKTKRTKYSRSCLVYFLTLWMICLVVPPPYADAFLPTRPVHADDGRTLRRHEECRLNQANPLTRRFMSRTYEEEEEEEYEDNVFEAQQQEESSSFLGEDLDTGAVVIQELSWRVQKLRLEEQNTQRFLRSQARFLPYNECRRWVQAFSRWETEDDWKQWISMGEKRNSYIPSRPDEYYGRLGQWVSWEHFLLIDPDADDTESNNNNGDNNEA